MIAAVVEQTGAIGWLEVPSRGKADAWLEGVFQTAGSGRGGLVVARAKARVEALGVWLAGPPGPVGHVAELTKVLAHPGARGLGLGKRVVSALVGACTTAGIEVITLGVRGNNHGAISLYEACGFRTWGVLPNAVAVDDLRFDDVRMFLPLPLPTGVRVRGSVAGGPGGSARRRAT
ncbi:GNAT family N-acetyltransferase [Micromonospora sp. U21]|uniref:GNAT family N-acetyltransferase n=1 Tax=Micromonospora sp. U21 TaxID=2824899 RepID=UPI001B36EA45|nr:GNAT family N-acetyltransferase [Micromonospora sp. U21]MBQ0905321.1 GNAT family N-acetyltransferase [Micromonospora sp. U21]